MNWLLFKPAEVNCICHWPLVIYSATVKGAFHKKVQYKCLQALVAHANIIKVQRTCASWTVHAGNVQKHPDEETVLTVDNVCRTWRDETPSWRIRFRMLKRRWPPVGRSRSSRRSRCDALSRFWTSRSATLTTWDRAWQSSSTNSHSSTLAASPQCFTGASAEQQSKQDGGKCAGVYLHGSVFLRSGQVNSRHQEPLKGAMCKVKHLYCTSLSH